MAQLNDSYHELFEIPSSKEAEEEKSFRDGEEGLDRDSGKNQAFSWMGLVDLVSETLRINWHEVYLISVVEFLNVAAYRKEKNRKEKEALEKWKKSN